MKVVFRSDASYEIGTGHVMRCLTLADALRERGADCRFICRAHEGNLIDLIRDRGHAIVALPAKSDAESRAYVTADTPTHARWLGTDWATDARQTANALADAPIDWLIIDHYALDTRWEHQLRPACRRLMVIDDLADRPHDCDLLLDQNLGRNASDYAPHVPRDCTLLIGPHYALLRPEFAALRAQSLARREKPQVKRLLITMGGVDKDNATGQVLDALKDCALPADFEITVVMGPHAPWFGPVNDTLSGLPYQAKILVGVENMAELMTHADLAIGAAGSTSWERCCLGLPTIMVVLADNQRALAAGLGKLGASAVIADIQQIPGDLPALINSLIDRPKSLVAMSQSAASLVDGAGADRIVQRLDAEVSSLRNQRVRRMRVSDLERVLEWRNHPDVRRYMYSQHEISLAEHTRWFEKVSSDSERYLLVFESNATPLGFINLYRKAPGGIADWGFYVAPDAPKGTGRSLGAAALRYAFSEIGLHKVCGETLAFNERSIRFHQALGFSQEGVLRQQHFDGRNYHDVVCFGLLANEWTPRE